MVCGTRKESVDRVRGSRFGGSQLPSRQLSPQRRLAGMLGLCLGLAALVGLSAAPAARSAPGDITMFPLPPNAQPNAVVGGPDGNVWFTDQSGKVGKITPAGTVTQFAVPTPFGAPFDITAGPDGNIWFTEIFGERVGRVTPDGTVTEFRVGGQPTGITVGPDGNLWFADMGLNSIRSITTSGAVGVNFGGLDNPRELVTGADGNLWVSESNSHAISRTTQAGSSTRFRLPSGSFFPNGVTAGPDGNVWFTTFDKVGKITPSGIITLFSPPSAGSAAFEITTGPDGNLWFTERNTGNIGQVTPSGTITEFATPAQPGRLRDIAAGPDGNIWFVDDGGRIGRIELAADESPPLLTVPTDITVDATSPSGAPVDFTVTATDDVDPNPTVTCTPASGSPFPIGNTTVTCTATDKAANTGRASFSVTVRGAAEQLAELRADVHGVGTGESLSAKVDAAQAAYSSGDERGTCEILDAVINFVDAQAGKHIPSDTADALIADATRIRAVLDC